MKAKVLYTITILIIMLMIPLVSSADIQIYVDEVPVTADVSPMMVSDRVLLPVRAIFEALDAEVEYIHSEQKVIAERRDRTVEFIIGSDIMKINGEEKIIDVPAMLKNGRTFIPVRACAEAFDLDVKWLNETDTVKITSAYRIERYEDEFEYIKEYDENGNMTYFSGEGEWEVNRYDDNGNVIYSTCKAETDAGDVFTYHTYDYDENGNETYYKSTEVVTYTNRDYDYGILAEIGNYVCELSVLNDKYVDKDKNQYDKNGNVIYAEDCFGRWEKYAYDDSKNVIYMENYRGNIYEFVYHNNMLVHYHNDKQTETADIQYDTSGNIISIKETDTFWKKTEYDFNGEVDSYISSLDDEKYSDDDAPYIEMSEYYYDENNLLIRKKGEYLDIYYSYYADGRKRFCCVEDVGFYRTGYYEYIYDDTGRLIYDELYEANYEYDERGNVTYVWSRTEDDPPVVWTKYYYDDNGRLISTEDEAGIVFNYLYDEFGRLSKELTADGEEVYRYTYDSDGKLILCNYESYSYDRSYLTMSCISIYYYDDNGNLIRTEKYRN